MIVTLSYRRPVEAPKDDRWTQFNARHGGRASHARDFGHLRARKYGAAVIVESGPKDDAYKHFRLTRTTAQTWELDRADHRGRWERTPFRASLEDLVALVADTFPWTLQPVHYPERTSDPEH
jgi:hypothetical protein